MTPWSYMIIILSCSWHSVALCAQRGYETAQSQPSVRHTLSWQLAKQGQRPKHGPAIATVCNNPTCVDTVTTRQHWPPHAMLTRVLQVWRGGVATSGNAHVICRRNGSVTSNVRMCMVAPSSLGRPCAHTTPPPSRRARPNAACIHERGLTHPSTV